MMDEEAQATEQVAPDSTQETPETTETQGGQETIFDGVEAAPAEQPAQEQEYVDTPENPDARPEWLPEKFKTPEELVKAYNEMGSKIREKTEPPEQYEVKLEDGSDVELTESDVEVFKDVGLNNEQAAKLTNYFYESVVPNLMEAKADIEKQRLSLEWNMDANSNEFTQQLAQVKSWANQNLPESVVTELSRTANGVATMTQLMEQGAKSHRAVGESSQPRPDKTQLMEMMNDQRYWNGDEDYREYVRQQFERAYD